jgi:hypothetical protein
MYIIKRYTINLCCRDLPVLYIPSQVKRCKLI